MSGRERRTDLRFALGFIAFQAVFLGVAGAGFIYMAQRYWFHFDQIAAEPVRRRYEWFDDIARTNGGETGAVIWAAFAMLTAWYAGIAAWRFLSDGKGAVLTRRGLVLHRSYLRGGEIPFEDVLSARVERGRNSSWLFPSEVLYIRFRDRRAVRLGSRETQGGAEALKGFAAELKARRTLGAHRVAVSDAERDNA